MILSTAYLPPIEYFQKIVSSPGIFIEKHEHFVKQTYRNRCHILGANGLQVLSIPLVNTHEKTPMCEKRISYAEKWQKLHWRSIRSAYANSPYFIYYEDALHPFYEKQFEFLFDYNTELLQVILKLMKIKVEMKFTEIYIPPQASHPKLVSGSDMGMLKQVQHDEQSDFREILSPKNEIEVSNFKPYSQVFIEKHSFIPNLSIIDLLFNKGPDSIDILS